MGVVGTKTLTSSPSWQRAMSPEGSPVTKPTDQMPRRGYSTSTTSRNVREDWESTVAKRLLQRPVDAAHDQGAVQQALAGAHHGPSDQPGGEPPIRTGPSITSSPIPGRLNGRWVSGL